MESQDKQMKANERVGLGALNGKFDYIVSEDLDINTIKAKAKSLGLSIGELFNTATVVAYSKLDLPEDRRPATYNIMNAYSCH